MWSLSDIGENISDRERYNTRACHCALHRERFARPCHAIREDGPVVAFHDSTHQSFGACIVDFCIVVMCSEDVVIVVISAFLAPISDEASSTIHHPFSLRLGIVCGARIWSDTDADEDIPFRFLSFRVPL